MFEKLSNAKRLLMEAELEPLQGSRFQPTGFPDLGAATYQSPDGTTMLLVESAQSVANRLEASILGPDNELIPELKGLSYIRVKFRGASEASTNSLSEAHRINSPFIISDTSFKETLKDEAEYAKGKPLNWQKIARAFFKYDINSLLHGAFLANLEDGRIKIPRSLSGFIEARNIQEAVSGGVKNNPIDPSGKLRASAFDKDVYGNVPYQRVEYTALGITAFFNFDLGLLHSYSLGQDAFELLVGLGLFKVRRFLESGLRLRTACDLQLKNDVRVTKPDGMVLPEAEELLETVQGKIKAVKNLLADPPVTELIVDTKWLKKKGEETEESGEEEATEETAEE
jgi:CRISPR-associated protein Csb1